MLAFKIFVIMAVIIFHQTKGAFEKLACQPGFTGEFIKEFEETRKTCESLQSNKACHTVCVGREIKVITDKGFDTNQLTKLMLKQLSGPGGKANVLRIMKAMSGCLKYATQIAIPCDTPTELWKCIGDVLECPSITQSKT